jgi:uncharacterized membrane protein
VTDPAADLVRAYLAELERQSQHLPADRRADLVAGIREHIDAARASGDAQTPDEIRALLARLGSPAEIVAAEHEDTHGAVFVHASPGTGRELAAVLLLSVGGVVIPIIGWIVGAVLLWTSPWWTRGDKLLGTLVWPGGMFAVLYAFTAPTTTCSGTQTVTTNGDQVTITGQTCTGFALPIALGVPLALLLFLAPAAVAIVLYRRARRRAEAGGPWLPAGPEPLPS